MFYHLLVPLANEWTALNVFRYITFRSLAALMTGSGAAVFGVFRDEKTAQSAKAELQKHYPRSWVLHPVPRGAHVLPARPAGKKK